VTRITFAGSAAWETDAAATLINADTAMRRMNDLRIISIARLSIARGCGQV
jgi:hypothetical protein